MGAGIHVGLNDGFETEPRTAGEIVRMKEGGKMRYKSRPRRRRTDLLKDGLAARELMGVTLSHARLLIDLIANSPAHISHMAPFRAHPYLSPVSGTPLCFASAVPDLSFDPIFLVKRSPIHNYRRSNFEREPMRYGIPLAQTRRSLYNWRGKPTLEPIFEEQPSTTARKSVKKTPYSVDLLEESYKQSPYKVQEPRYSPFPTGRPLGHNHDTSAYTNDFTAGHHTFDDGDVTMEDEEAYFPWDDEKTLIADLIQDGFVSPTVDSAKRSPLHS
jgi:hypothetical protein